MPKRYRHGLHRYGRPRRSPVPVNLLFEDRRTVAGAVSTGTGPQLRARISLYLSGSSARPSFSTLRLMTWKRTDTSRTCSTSSSQREVIQGHGQAGSTYRSTSVIAILRSGTKEG